MIKALVKISVLAEAHVVTVEINTCCHSNLDNNRLYNLVICELDVRGAYRYRGPKKSRYKRAKTHGRPYFHKVAKSTASKYHTFVFATRNFNIVIHYTSIPPRSLPYVTYVGTIFSNLGH